MDLQESNKILLAKLGWICKETMLGLEQVASYATTFDLKFIVRVYFGRRRGPS